MATGGASQSKSEVSAKSIEENKAVVRRMIEDVLNANRPNLIGEVFSPELQAGGVAYGLDVLRVAEGRIAEEMAMGDDLGLLQQLGYAVVPASPAAVSN